MHLRPWITLLAVLSPAVLAWGCELPGSGEASRLSLSDADVPSEERIERALGVLVADLQIEMIGRPDSLARGPGRGRLTGCERSTMGDMAGIPAHTLSSFGLHRDCHTPGDEVERVDFAHMDALVGAALATVREMASGPTPAWKEGGRPE